MNSRLFKLNKPQHHSQAQNAAGAGLASSILTAMTSTATGPNAPAQVVGLAAIPTGSTPVTSFTVYCGVTGWSNWTSSATASSGSGTAITGLQAAT
jgi:hypothetical protein